MESATGSCDEVGTEHHDDAKDITGIVTSLFGSERLMVVVPTAREPTASPDDDEGDTVKSCVRRILESTLRDTPPRERSHRVGQARFLLAGMDVAGCSPAERRTVLESLALQPESVHGVDRHCQYIHACMWHTQKDFIIITSARFARLLAWPRS